MFGLGKYVAIAGIGLLAFWYLRHDAAQDARTEMRAEVEEATGAELLRQREVADAAIQEAAAEAERHKQENERLRNEIADIGPSDGCVVPDDLADRLRNIR